MKNILLKGWMTLFVIFVVGCNDKAPVAVDECQGWTPEIANKQDSKEALYRKLEENTRMQRRCQ